MIRIVTDSTASLPEAWIREYDLVVVPLSVTFGADTYREGVEMSNDAFYDRMRVSPQLPTTSQPAVGDFYKVFDELTAKGDEVVSIHLSSKLSGTYNSAAQAAAMLPRGGVTVVETEWISLALAFQVREAARAARAGQDIQGIIDSAQRLSPKLHLYLLLETLENLKKGGRISPAKAMIGGLLNVKPILAVIHGAVEPVEQPRSKKVALRRLLDIMGTTVPFGTEIHLAFLHAQALPELTELERMVYEKYTVLEAATSEVGPTIGTHVGLGAVGIVYYAE